MSTDPQEILYYGIHIGEEPTYPDGVEDYHEMNEQWEKSHAPTRPEGDDYKSTAWEEWRARHRTYEKSPAHVEISWSGTDNCHDNGFYVCCSCLKKTVEWDDHLDIGSISLGSNSEANAAIREFCERFSLPYKQPRWHLAVQYF